MTEDDKYLHMANLIYALNELEHSDKTYVITLALMHGSTYQIAEYINRVTSLLAGVTAKAQNPEGNLVFSEAEQIMKDLNEDNLTTLGLQKTHDLITRFTEVTTIVDKNNVQKTH